MRRWKFLSLAFVALFVLAGTGWAQSTGAIRGKVLDAESNPVPGAMVRATSDSLLGERVTYSEGTGAFSFGALPIGTYTIEVTLTGFAKYRHEGIRLYIGQTKDVPIKLELETVSEEITVVAEEPLLDPKDVSTGGRITFEELTQVPTARDPWAVLSLIPSLQVDRINVGGSQSGQQANFVSKGDDGSNAMWNIDGVPITDQAAAGASSTYFDYGSIEEIQVSTGGADVTQMTGGAGINIVTKKGGNKIRGSARAVFTNDGLQGENLSTEIRSGTLATARVDQILELGGEVGFPIIKDRLWGWGAINRNKIENNILSYKGDPDKPVSQPDNTTLFNVTGKLNAQVFSSNEATIFYERGDKTKKGRNASLTRPEETTWNQKGPTPIYKVEDQHIFGSNTILHAKFGAIGGAFQLTPLSGGTYEDVNSPLAWRDGDRVWHGSYGNYFTDRPQSTFLLDANHFMTTGNIDHDFKVGFEFRRASVDSDWYFNGGQFFLDDLFGPGVGYVQFMRNQPNKASQQRVSAFLQDTLTVGNLTVNIGVRFDSQKGNHEGGTQRANPVFPDLMPTVSFEPGSSQFTWNNLAPRIGLTYAIGEKTLVNASYSLYADNLTLGLVGTGNPAYIYTSVYAAAIDSNGDGRIDPDTELVSNLYGPYSDPSVDANLDQLDSDLGSPSTNEVVFGGSHQLTRDFVMGANFTYRTRSNTTWALATVIDETGNLRPVQNGDFTVAGSVSGSYQQAGGDSGTYSQDYYTLREGLTWNRGSFTTNRDDYKEKYWGLEVTWNKRMSTKWMVGGNFVLSRWTESFDANGAGADPDPTRTLGNPNPDGSGSVAAGSGGSGAFGGVFMNAEWQGNLRGSYRLPFDLEIGGNINIRQGYPIPVEDTRGSSALTRRANRRNILVTEIDSLRHDTPFVVDLRLAYTPKFGPVDVELGIDFFNILNTDTVLQQRRLADLSSYGDATEVVGPRLIRFGGSIKF